MNNHEEEIHLSMNPKNHADLENKFKLNIHQITTHLEENKKHLPEESQLGALNGILSYLTTFHSHLLREFIRQLESLLDSSRDMESFREHYIMKFSQYDKWKEFKVQEITYFQRKYLMTKREVTRELKRLENQKGSAIKQRLENLGG